MRSSSERAVDATVGKRIMAWMTLGGLVRLSLGVGGWDYAQPMSVADVVSDPASSNEPLT